MAGDAISTPPAAETGDPREVAPAPNPTTAGDPIFDRLEEEIQW